MRRMQLMELEDLPDCPAVLRDGGTAFLELAERMSGHGRMLLAPLERALDATGARDPRNESSQHAAPAA